MPRPRNHHPPRPENDAPAQEQDGETLSRRAIQLTQDQERAIDLLRHYLKHERPPVTDNDLEDIVGPEQPSFDDEWSQADEDRLRSEWDQSNEKQSLAHVSRNTLPPWKIAMRLFRLTPVAIISPLQNLVYQPLPARGSATASPIHSEAFSTNLASILSHPFWESQIVRLVLALQYAVICRLDDRRHWEVPGFCDALRELTAAMDESPPELLNSIHEMHVEARSKCVPGRPPSAMSDFLEHLGNTAAKARYLTMPSIEMECFGRQVYPVTVKDLDVLIVALNTYSRQGCPVFCSVSWAYQAYKEASNPLDMPKANQFPGFYERATLSERRVLTQLHRRGEAQHERRAITKYLSESTTDTSLRSPEVQSSSPQSQTRAPAEHIEVRGLEELKRYVDRQMESLTKFVMENTQKNEDTMKEALQHLGLIWRQPSHTPRFPDSTRPSQCPEEEKPFDEFSD